MIAIELTFPAGRFHATPWGRHVNEGAVEWPPSPWRLLRALVATWKRKADDLADDATMEAILTKLSEPPEFVLPPATFGHTRHYMPWFKKGPGDKTLVFDSFVALGKTDPLITLWPGTELSEKEKHILANLLPLLGTFGRAESWCDARLLDPEFTQTASTHVNSRPLSPQSTPPTDTETIRLLGVDPATAFQNDQNPKFQKTTGRGKNKTTTTTVLYDPDWHLCMETLWLHDQRLSMPPGARWLDYTRQRSALGLPKPKARTRPQRLIQVARFALDSTVLPLLTDTLRVAEAARVNLMGIHGRLTETNGIRGKSRIFAGKEADGTPVQGHTHCYFLPTDEDGDGRLDHLTLCASGGFSTDDLRAIDKLRTIKSRDREESGHPLRVILLGMGTAEDFQPFPLKDSCCWVSATPFVSPRLPKASGRAKPRTHEDRLAFVESQLRIELQRWLDRTGNSLALDKVDIELFIDGSANTRRWCSHKNTFRERPIQFRRFRHKRDDDGGKRPAAFFRLTFPEPVPGPIALGHSSHFGLGLFFPVSSSS